MPLTQRGERDDLADLGGAGWLRDQVIESFDEVAVDGDNYVAAHARTGSPSIVAWRSLPCRPALSAGLLGTTSTTKAPR